MSVENPSHAPSPPAPRAGGDRGDRTEPAGTGHPFLLVRAADYPALRARADRSPWREMRDRALREAAARVDDPGREIRGRSVDLARALSVTALAFVLDPEHADTHRDRIAGLIGAFDPAAVGNLTARMRANPDKTLWTHAVPTGNAFVQAVLALDIVHDHLPPARLEHLEGVLSQGPAAYFRDTALAWHQGTWAARAIWPLYRRDEGAYGPVVRAWLHDTLGSVSADGVFTGGPGYAAARWTNPDREHKALFGEILQHAGVLPDWYAEPRIRLLHEWMHGYAHTPFGVTWTFGDSSPMPHDHDEAAGPERAHRYGRRAGRLAAHRNARRAPIALLSTYVLTQEPAPEPEAAPSRVFPDGGAWLTEGNDDPEALAVVLLNLRDARDAHAHKETNGLNLAAYGELLLRGGGYAGWRTGEQGFSWEYVHDRAVAANVALFDYPVPTTEDEQRRPSPVHDHAATTGTGITDALLTGAVDYALGGSGPAIPNGRHDRGLLFVHPGPGTPGYVVVLDELVGDAEHAQLVWHPAATGRVGSADGSRHRWRVRESSRLGVDLTLQLATPPDRVTTHQGITASWTGGRRHEYLVAHYALGPTARRRVVAVLFPHDGRRRLADLQRLDRPDLTGSTVRQGGVEDVVYAVHRDVVAEPVPGVRVRTRFGYHRRSADGRLRHTWLAGATGYFPEHGPGFSSDQQLTAFVDGNQLRTTCPAPATLVLHRARRATVDGQAVPVHPSGPGVELSLPRGEHLVELG